MKKEAHHWKQPNCFPYLNSSANTHIKYIGEIPTTTSMTLNICDADTSNGNMFYEPNEFFIEEEKAMEGSHFVIKPWVDLHCLVTNKKFPVVSLPKFRKKLLTLKDDLLSPS